MSKRREAHGIFEDSVQDSSRNVESEGLMTRVTGEDLDEALYAVLWVCGVLSVMVMCVRLRQNNLSEALHSDG